MTFRQPAGAEPLIDDLSKFKACEFWLHSFRSSETGRSYELGLKLFCRFHRTNPDKIVKCTPETIERMLMQYIVYLKKNAVTQGQTKPQVGRIHINSIANYVFPVKHFLRKSYGKKFQHIDWERIKDMIPERIRTEYRAYTKEEIRSLLEVANLRMRVIVLLMTSGGMRVGALPALKFKNIHELSNDMPIPQAVNERISGKTMGTVSLYADSAKDHYFSFLNIECMATLKRWIDYRIHLGENLSEESYVIRDTFGRNSRRTNHAKPLKAISIMRRMRQLVVKVLKETDNLQTDHAFRKFFDTSLVVSDVNHMFKELMMGHSIGLDEIYFDEKNPAARQKILAEYMKASDALTINDEYRLKKEVADLKEQTGKVSLLETQLAELKVKFATIADRFERARIAYLQRTIFGHEITQEELEKALADFESLPEVRVKAQS